MTSSPKQAIDQLLIVGAGFSYYAGLPLQSKFTAELLRASGFHKGPSKRIVDFLCKFVGATFHPRLDFDPDGWPELEDLFTCVNMSANTGHHLGAKHPAASLRTVRRALIARTIRMLRQSYERASQDPDDRWKSLDAFLTALSPQATAFLSLNWDTVAEERFLEVNPKFTIAYGPGFIPARFPEKGARVEILQNADKPTLHVAKIHGSINWLYCDNCQRVYWFRPAEALKIADQILSKNDWELIAPRAPANAKKQWECTWCDAVKLGTRIATFSYRKALDFPMFQHSWTAAERLLKRARRWVFIGYSLPAADFEFKYLLKRVELSREKPPEVILVTGGDGAATTRTSFEIFFGDRLSRREFQDSLNDEVIQFLAAA